MYFQRLITKVKENPLEQFLGLWVVLIIMFGASVKDVASTALAIFSIYGLINIHKVRNGWQDLQANEKILMVLGWDSTRVKIPFRLKEEPNYAKL